MGADQMPVIGDLITRALSGRTDPTAIQAVRAEVAALCAAFPAY